MLRARTLHFGINWRLEHDSPLSEGSVSDGCGIMCVVSEWTEQDSIRPVICNKASVKSIQIRQHNAREREGYRHIGRVELDKVFILSSWEWLQLQLIKCIDWTSLSFQGLCWQQCVCLCVCLFSLIDVSSQNLKQSSATYKYGKSVFCYRLNSFVYLITLSQLNWLYNIGNPVWWPGLKNSPTVTHACFKRRLKLVPSAWGYS
jgi:hypothetical protein